MIRLLYFAPVIGIVGCLVIVYLIYARPVLKNEKGKDISAAQAIDDIKSDLKSVKKHQDMLSGTMEIQKGRLLLQSKTASELYEQASRGEYQDMDLVRLRESVNTFNRQALDLASNETAIIQFNDQLRDGISHLDKQIKEIDLSDLLRSKEDIANRINSMKIQVAKLVELQREIIGKSKEYNDQARQSIITLKSTLKEETQKNAALKDDRTLVLQQTIEDTIAKQNEMLVKTEEQNANLMSIREQNMEQMHISKERVKDIIEETRSRMETITNKKANDQDMLQDSRERMRDAKTAAEAAKERQRAMQESLRDRRR